MHRSVRRRTPSRSVDANVWASAPRRSASSGGTASGGTDHHGVGVDPRRCPRRQLGHVLGHPPRHRSRGDRGTGEPGGVGAVPRRAARRRRRVAAATRARSRSAPTRPRVPATRPRRTSRSTRRRRNTAVEDRVPAARAGRTAGRRRRRTAAPPRRPTRRRASAATGTSWRVSSMRSASNPAGASGGSRRSVPSSATVTRSDQ